MSSPDAPEISEVFKEEIAVINSMYPDDFEKAEAATKAVFSVLIAEDTRQGVERVAGEFVAVKAQMAAATAAIKQVAKICVGKHKGGYTEAGFADLVGVSRNTVRSWLNK